MNNSINNNISTGGKFGAMVNGAGRFGSGGGGAAPGQDVTDNAIFNGNGFGNGGLRTKVISSQSQISSVKETEKVVKKSFIQQRVEKLYGNAEGVVINKQIYNSNERKYLNNIANENVNKNYANALHMNGNGNVATNGGSHAIGAGGGGVGFGGGGGTKENLDENNKEIADDPDMEALPVLRHLRPEFRAQLQIFSPKKVPKTSPSRSVASLGNGAVSLNGTNNNHIISNGDLSHHHHHSHFANGKVTSNGTTTSLSSTSSTFPSSSASSVLESKRDLHTNGSSSSTTVTTTRSTTSLKSFGVTCSESRSDSSLSVVTATDVVTSSYGSDATTTTLVPLYDSCRSTTQESGAPITTKPTTDATVAIEQASAEQQPPSGVEQTMKLAEPSTMTMMAVVNGAEGGECAVGTVTRNGTSRKNGHYDPLVDEHDKENVGDAGSSKAQVKDGNHFLQVLKNEQNRLLTMAADIERDVEQLKADGVEISEEVAGYVLVAAGKARLLCSQKMKQFEGLCHKNLHQSPDEKFQTTCEDLRGFWDMVMLQVNDVDASFRELDSFRRNGWKKPVPASPTPQVRSTARSTKLTKRPFKAPATAAVNGGSNPADRSVAEAKKAAAAAVAAKREAQRKQLMELKRKQKLANGQQNVEIFVPEAVTNGAPKVPPAETNGTPSPALVDAS